MRLDVAAAFDGGEIVPGDVELADGVVTAVGLSPRGSGLAVPGYVDLQVNGWAGVDLHTAEADDRERLSAALAEAGTTSWRPTLISAPEDELTRALQGPWPRACLGVHLEGPFLSPEKGGAHPPEYLRAPDLGELRRLLSAGPVTHVTLAPELPGALALIAELTERGVLAAAGHTAANTLPASIRAVTHLHNAMAPTVVVAALAREDIAIQVIVDLLHVPGDTVRADYERSRGRFSLVSDCVGDSLGGRPVEASGGEVKGGHGRLAGSRLTMADAVRNLHALGVPLAEALAAATSIPAALAGRPDLGRLIPGQPADVVVLDDALEVRRVLVAGGA
jgi:N-acetylglucosamine-6-phosphate deacetylase